jgi:hypothetical protein
MGGRKNATIEKDKCIYMDNTIICMSLTELRK